MTYASRSIASRITFLVLLTCPTVFSATMPQQSQSTKQSSAKRTRTKSTNGELAEQRNTRLQRFEFAKDSQAISYFFKSGNKQRVVTYRVGKDSSVTVEVKPTTTGKPFVELFVTSTRVRARTPAGDYQLIKGQRVLPATTDALSLWLLANNFPTKPATSPLSLYERGLQELNRTKKTKYTAVAAFENRIGIFSDSAWTTQAGNEWLFPDPGGGSDCTPSDVVCTEIDAFGTAKTIHCYCDCGVPICYEVLLSGELQVVERDPNTGAERIYTQTVHYTKCVIGGCEMPITP